MMKIAVAVLILCALAYAHDESLCKDVGPTASFKLSLFEGIWYEIGYFRSTGAGAFNDGCTSSRSNMTLDTEGIDEGDAIYTYACNIDDPKGTQTSFETELVEMSPAGKWVHVVLPLFNPHEFVVLELAEDFALTYRCGDYGVAESYTVQFLSRKLSMEPATL